jgi:hypothetical protein
MSDTVSEAAPAATNETSAGLAAMVKELGIEDYAPDASETSDAATPQQDDRPELPEGIPAKDTLKINGKEVEKTYAEIKADAQKYAATEIKLEQAKKQVEEAKQMQAQVAQHQQVIRNLLGVLQRGDLETIGNFAAEHLNAGETFNKAVIQYALKLYEYSKMSPEQREAIENKKLLQKMRAEAELRQKQDQERAFELRVNEWSEHIATEIPRAIKEVGLTDSAFVREHIVSTWRAAIERGQNPTARAVAAFVKQRFDEAKLGGAPAPAAPVIPPRRRATPESVGLKRSSGQPEQQGYMSFTDWQKSRGR